MNKALLRPACPHCRRRMPRRLPGYPGPRQPDHEVPEVDVVKVRQAFEHSGMTKTQLAQAMGWVREVANIDRVNEVLGYRKGSRGKFKKRLTYGLAVRLAKAMNADYRELGV